VTSVHTRADVGEAVPVFAAFSVGVADLARAGIALMLFGQSELNSFISVGAWFRVGSSASGLSGLQLGDNLSTLSWAAFGSSVSMGSFLLSDLYIYFWSKETIHTWLLFGFRYLARSL
jgi:hypothetical protein